MLLGRENNIEKYLSILKQSTLTDHDLMEK